MYSKRHREADVGRIAVREFISQSIIDQIANNPEALQDLEKTQFEQLMAELFARMGYHVDLYRSSKDDGIDFLRVDVGQDETTVFCVQCKHPDKAEVGKKRRPLPVATVREIYGVAKANDMHGCVAVTSSTYTPDARRFADLKPDEIHVADAADIITWIKQYRWNSDE